jgi:Flp pilus assembly pilin Flp
MQNFIQDETGAVTVDWVVLTAALVGLGLAVMGVVSSGISSQADAIDDTLTNESIIRTSFTSGAVADFGTACGNFGGCDASLGNLASLSNSDFNALRDSFSTDEAGAVATTNTGLGLTQDGDGNWGAVDGNGDFQIDQGATDTFNAAAAYDAAATAAVAAEDAARSNN